jgi:hypothetical protein
MRSFSLRTRCATASRRGSAAPAPFARAVLVRALLDFDAVLRAARGLLALDFALVVLRVVFLAPVDLLALARFVPDVLDFEPLLLACGTASSLDDGRAHLSSCIRCYAALAAGVHWSVREFDARVRARA